GVEKAVEGGQLAVASLEAVEVAAEVTAPRQGFEIPAGVLAGDARAHHRPVKAVQLDEVIPQGGAHLLPGRRRQQGAGGQVVVDLAEDPGAALGGAADHYRRRAGA